MVACLCFAFWTIKRLLIYCWLQSHQTQRIIQMLDTLSDSLGQGCVLQESVSVALPVQSSPPYSGGTHSLCLSDVSPPQVTVHSDHCVQLPQYPSTEITKQWKPFKNYNQWTVIEWLTSSVAMEMLNTKRPVHFTIWLICKETMCIYFMEQALGYLGYETGWLIA